MVRIKPQAHNLAAHLPLVPRLFSAERGRSEYRTAPQWHQPFKVAMSITKRYFTSPTIMRS